MRAKRHFNILIGIPSQTIWQAEFGMCLAMLCTWSERNRLSARSTAEKFEVFNMRGSILPYLREHIVEQAWKTEATHLLFLDSDQTFPKDTIRRLLGWDQLVVATNIPTKKVPTTPTARIYKPGEVGGEPLYSQGREGLQRVWRVGTGVMLIDMRVFDMLSQPFFPIRWSDERKQYYGEDWMFCEVCENAGIPIFVDHTLSKMIGHCGSMTFTHDHIVTEDEYRRVQAAMAA